MLSRVRLFETPRPVAHQSPLSTGILQARILEWGATSFSRRSSRPRDQTLLESRFFTTLPLCCLESRFFTTKLPGKPLELLLPLMETSAGNSYKTLFRMPGNRPAPRATLTPKPPMCLAGRARESGQGPRLSSLTSGAPSRQVTRLSRSTHEEVFSLLERLRVGLGRQLQLTFSEHLLCAGSWDEHVTGLL